MSVKLGLAKTASAILTWGLRHVARRPAANTPGLVALKIDPGVIGELRGKMAKGSIVVVGTNGKTTVTNLLANVVEKQGFSVLCNRTGANLNSGIASALLQNKGADWGVLECDELWSAKVVPQLKPTYFLLLNLFRDQLDRCGEIDHIQDAIVSGLVASPETILIYNADDPLCEMVAERVDAERKAARSAKHDGTGEKEDDKGSGLMSSSVSEGADSIPFGTLEPMGLEQNQVADATMCQRCLTMFTYDYRQYGQLGAYRCSNCGFARPSLRFGARDIKLVPGNLEFDIVERPDTAREASLEGHSSSETPRKPEAPEASEASETLRIPETLHVRTKLNGTYMVYNLLAVSAAALTMGCSAESITDAVADFDPKNGRLQEYCVDGRRTLLNLAKNPTGFNQNLRIVNADKGPKAAAFFINTQVVDGFDVSWIWDIDFEELASQSDTRVFAGGARNNDLQVRLKYAGINAQLIDDIDDVYKALANDPKMPATAPVYAIANYTALPRVKRQLDKMADQGRGKSCAPAFLDSDPDSGFGEEGDDGKKSEAGYREKDDIKPDTLSSSEYAITTDTPVVIAHILPDLLNLYGDGGNVRVLEQRLAWRGIPVEVKRVHYGQAIDLDAVDLVVLGGSPDKEQRLASEELRKIRDDLARYVDEDGPMLAICGSYQMLGRVWLLDGEEVPGLGILDIETRRPGTSTDRLISDIALETPFSDMPVIGFENHAGRTYLDEGVQPFGRVVSEVGVGNNEDGSPEQYADGVLFKGVIGTYLHGPLLSKNPDVADHLLKAALERKAHREGVEPLELSPLDDTEEHAANAFMARNWAL